jgi:hypothetical protein
MMHGLRKYYEKKTGLRGGPPIPHQHELDPIAVELIKAGARSWDAVPEPCVGLKRALHHVWKRGSDIELRYFYEKLEENVKVRLCTNLLVLHRYLPGATEVQMQILVAGL